MIIMMGYIKCGIVMENLCGNGFTKRDIHYIVQCVKNTQILTIAASPRDLKP